MRSILWVTILQKIFCKNKIKPSNPLLSLTIICFFLFVNTQKQCSQCDVTPGLLCSINFWIQIRPQLSTPQRHVISQKSVSCVVRRRFSHQISGVGRVTPSRLSVSSAQFVCFVPLCLCFDFIVRHAIVDVGWVVAIFDQR